MLPLTEENVLQALKAVKDPDLHRDIVTLNFVKNLKISGNNVSFTLELTTPACPVRDQFKADSERAIRSAVSGVGKVDVQMTSSVATHTNQQKDLILPGVKTRSPSPAAREGLANRPSQSISQLH